jgi:hypothetical protein
MILELSTEFWEVATASQIEEIYFGGTSWDF